MLVYQRLHLPYVYGFHVCFWEHLGWPSMQPSMQPSTSRSRDFCFTIYWSYCWCNLEIWLQKISPSKTLPTDPESFKKPQTPKPNQQFMMVRNSWIIWGWKGMFGVCETGVCWVSLRHQLRQDLSIYHGNPRESFICWGDYFTHMLGGFPPNLHFSMGWNRVHLYTSHLGKL